MKCCNTEGWLNYDIVGKCDGHLIMPSIHSAFQWTSSPRRRISRDHENYFRKTHFTPLCQKAILYMVPTPITSEISRSRKLIMLYPPIFPNASCATHGNILFSGYFMPIAGQGPRMTFVPFVANADKNRISHISTTTHLLGYSFV